MRGLKMKRTNQSLSLKTLSSNIGCSLNTIWQYEKGKRFPRKEMLDKLTAFFNCTIDELL